MKNCQLLQKLWHSNFKPKKKNKTTKQNLLNLNAEKKKDPIFTSGDILYCRLQPPQLLLTLLLFNTKHKHTQKGSFLPVPPYPFSFLSQEEIPYTFHCLVVPLQFFYSIFSNSTASNIGFL